MVNDAHMRIHMVKSLTAIGVSVLLLLGLALFEWQYVDREFRDFREEVHALGEKTARGEAGIEDARLVRRLWEGHRDGLHVWIPHNDISRIDDYLAEALRYVAEQQNDLALAKLEIVLHLCETVPGTYKPGVENIF